MACKVARSRHGTLALRLHWRGRRSWEGTGLRDTKANREQLQRLADVITAEIRAMQFTPERYLHYFPNGNRAREFRPQPEPTWAREAGRQATLSEYYVKWIARKQPPVVRPGQARDYRLHLENYVLPALINDGGCTRPLGELLVGEIRPAHLEDLRQQLLRGTRRPLKLKTVRNIMDASFRALLRDARMVDQLISADPFAALTWLKVPKPKPDPFTAEERDTILRWFFEHRRFYYVFVLTLFHTGMRPSEAVALRWGDVDTERGTIEVSKSRYLGSEGPPKTEASNRTVYLLPIVRDALRDVKPLHAEPDQYVFVNEWSN